MPPFINQRWLLDKRPQGVPTDDCWKWSEVPVAPLQPGEILVKVLYLSIDPYMRTLMNEGGTYVDAVKIGHPMIGESVGVVVESQSTKYAVGDYLCVHCGWQSYITVPDNDPQLFRVDPKIVPLPAYLGTVGMPGRTGYFGLLRIGEPQAGETVVVSAASGAVGTVVGQMAKILGCRAVGIAGGETKCNYVKHKLQLDDCVDYKAGNLAADLQRACPNGVDVYFENVGGDVTHAVAPLLNPGARVPVCGFISKYNSLNIDGEETPFDVLGKLSSPPTSRFFVVTEWFAEFRAATEQLCQWVQSGELKYRETIAEGLEHAPQALRDVLQGRNFGKQIVRVAAE